MPDKHEALKVFIGDWSAHGTAYGPAGDPAPWHSVHSARWHSGNFFVVQDERANGPFDTMSFLGWDPDRDTYFASTIENHGFARRYDVTHDDDTWTFAGDQERATISFSDDGRTQTHHWEWRPEQDWVPLCDRVATRVQGP